MKDNTNSGVDSNVAHNEIGTPNHDSNNLPLADPPRQIHRTLFDDDHIDDTSRIPILHQIGAQLNVPVIDDYHVPDDLSIFRNVTMELVMPILIQYIGSVDKSKFMPLGVLTSTIHMDGSNDAAIVNMPVISYGDRIVPYNRLAGHRTIDYLLKTSIGNSLFMDDGGVTLNKLLTNKTQLGNSTVQSILSEVITSISTAKQRHQDSDGSFKSIVRALAPKVIGRLPMIKSVMSGVRLTMKPTSYHLVSNYQYDLSMAYDMKAMSQPLTLTINTLNPGELLNDSNLQQTLLSLMIDDTKTNGGVETRSGASVRSDGRQLW